MTKVVIIGGGWAGVGAAVAAKNAGADVVVLERTDLLLGTGLVGGIMRNNGRFTATEEAIAMGGGEVFQVVDENCRHKNIEFPGHKHASLYDIATIEPAIERLLQKKGVEFKLSTKVVAVEPGKVVCEADGKKFEIPADKVLLSIGRRAATEGIGLENIGVAAERGDFICR